PKLYKYYNDVVCRTEKFDPSLQFPFPKSVFSMATFNLGGCVFTERHFDVCDFAGGLCSIQALGNYNHKKCGHLVLYELRLVIEFPPRSEASIPSACVSHSNIPVTEEDEFRASFTQYTLGGLCQW
ncbi:hypothetical protein PUNSTDRAFT_31403, partial [Punctularia strigosozonata HHB-11173 SS5]